MISSVCRVSEGDRSSWRSRLTANCSDLSGCDVALVDLGLPVMDGFEVARRVRKSNRTTRLVALSGYGQDNDIQAALNAGFDEHLTKPTDPERLKQVLASPPLPRTS
jgi:CheY-like chemotaxis protein